MNYHNSTIRIKPGAKGLKRTEMRRVPGTARLERTGPIKAKCVVCGKFFQTWPYRIRDGVKTCSTKCGGVIRRNRSIHNCAACGKEFERAISQVFHRGVKYCSRECFNQGQIAEAADRPTRDKWGRTSRHADKVWQKSVREKDGYTCQRCGKVEKHIHTHHVAPRSRRPDLKHDVANGKCLCNGCHSWVHEHPIEATALGLLSGETYELARKKVEGAQHGMAKLSAAQVRSIRARRAAGESAEDIAKDFELSRSAVFRVARRETYQNVD